jgi:signal transduction histidine kinase
MFPTRCCDALRIRQILFNLLGNAIKFTGAGFIRVQVQLESQVEESVVLHFGVSDSGCGIAPKAPAASSRLRKPTVSLPKIRGTGLD